MALVLDTGVLYATLDAKQPHHGACLDLMTNVRERLIIPDPVLVELDYFMRRTGTGGWTAFVRQVQEGTYSLYPLSSATLVRAADLEHQYANLRLGLVDAAVVATCEELGEDKVASLDRRHFSVVRTKLGKALTILPA